MKQDSVFYVGVDVSKAKHAIAIAEGGRHGADRGGMDLELGGRPRTRSLTLVLRIALS
ncbi:hypothetical protein [Rhizobium sullae]|uniref:hypothetical protein n=1 Tax=Rhizobium sullae TaxID=50338 RepID=UPI0015C68A53|nr:hypothetical protein [Rhizobium sullae]